MQKKKKNQSKKYEKRFKIILALIFGVASIVFALDRIMKLQPRVLDAVGLGYILGAFVGGALIGYAVSILIGALIQVITGVTFDQFITSLIKYFKQ